MLGLNYLLLIDK